MPPSVFSIMSSTSNDPNLDTNCILSTSNDAKKLSRRILPKLLHRTDSTGITNPYGMKHMILPSRFSSTSTVPTLPAYYRYRLISANGCKLYWYVSRGTRPICSLKNKKYTIMIRYMPNNIHDIIRILCLCSFLTSYPFLRLLTKYYILLAQSIHNLIHTLVDFIISQRTV